MKHTKTTLLFILLSFFLLTSCRFVSSLVEETNLSRATTTYATLQNTDAPSSYANIESTASPDESSASQVESAIPKVETTASPVSVPQVESTTVRQKTNAETDYSSYTKKQIIDIYAKALNKTRSYKGNLSVQHNEVINTKVIDAHPGGALAARFINYVLGLIGRGGEETLNFSGGKAVNKDKETIPLLLPQRTSFKLPESGVASASIEKSGDMLHIVLTLAAEKVSMGKAPEYNSGAIGYLDTAAMDFKLVKLNRVDINYPGSVIDAYIRSDDYISVVNYTIKMKTYAEVSGMGISGSGTLEGSQSEKWSLNW